VVANVRIAPKTSTSKALGSTVVCINLPGEGGQSQLGHQLGQGCKDCRGGKESCPCFAGYCTYACKQRGKLYNVAASSCPRVVNPRASLHAIPLAAPSQPPPACATQSARFAVARRAR
jgi:hypothetical protein